MIRIGFFGTPFLASVVLSDLINDDRFHVSFVVTNPDKPFGRDQILRASPVKELAQKTNIPVYQPEKIRGNEDFLDHIRAYECDYFVVVAYGKILPMDLLLMPKKLSINVHGSILPRYRGASPIQAALLHGETKTGVTIMKMSEGMDEGDILMIRDILIDQRETSDTLFQKFSNISGATLIDTILGFESGTIIPIPQDHAQATYCKKIEKEDGLIDWTLSAKDIYQKWQAYTPWPGIFTHYDGKRLLLEGIQNSKFKIQNSGTIGQVIKLEDGQIGIICGEGILTLERVKLEGKKSQNIKDFVNGNQGFIGYNFL